MKIFKLLYVLFLLIFPSFQSAIDDDAIEFFKDFENAQKEVFEWLRDEYRFRRMPTRYQRDVDSVNGDTWYKNYQIKECQSGSNKSSFCKRHHENEKHAPEISELFDDLDKKDKATWSDGEKLQLPTHRDGTDEDDAGRINDKNMKVEQQQQHLPPVSDQRGQSVSNYSPIEARLSAKQFLVKDKNAIHEIEMKHQHLADDGRESSKNMMGLSEIRLRTSSNSNFPFAFNLDTSSGDIKRSADQTQTGQQQRREFDDQVDQKKNDLFDEADEKLSRHEQQGLQALHRVKRRDKAGMNMELIDRSTKEMFEKLLKDKSNDEILKFLDDSIKFNSNVHANTSTSPPTAEQEMNNGDLRDNFCNETFSVNNNQTTASALTTAKIKREISHHRNHHQRQRAIKGKQKISDLISGELPNEIVKAVHNLVNSNQKLKQHIKPHLSEPKYTKLKDSSKLSSIKIDGMMSDLVEFINELVDDQIHMRTCIPLTDELKDFYKKLMGRDVGDVDSTEDENDDYEDGDERYEKSVERFLTPRKRFTRKATKLSRATAEEINEKCEKVHRFQAKSTTIPLTEEQKKYFEKFFKSHNKICDEMRVERKRKRALNYPANITKDFIKLEAFKNYVSEQNLNDL